MPDTLSTTKWKLMLAVDNDRRSLCYILMAVKWKPLGIRQAIDGYIVDGDIELNLSFSSKFSIYSLKNWYVIHFWDGKPWSKY